MASRPPSGPSPNAATPGPKVSNATARANCSKESGVKPKNWCPTFTSGIEQAATWLLSPCIRRAVAPVPHPIRNVGCESLRQARQAPRQLVGHCGSIWLNETAVGPPWHTKIRPCAARRVKWFGLDPLAHQERASAACSSRARYRTIWERFRNEEFSDTTFPGVFGRSVQLDAHLLLPRWSLRAASLYSGRTCRFPAGCRHGRSRRTRRTCPGRPAR